MSRAIVDRALTEKPQEADGVRDADAPLRIAYNHRTQSRDGQFVHIEELITALRALRHEVIVVEPGRRRSADLGDDSKGGLAAKKYIPSPLYELMELGYSVPEFLRLALACLRRRPDALYQRANLFMLSGLLCARFFGIPYLLEVNAPLTEERRRFGNLRLVNLAQWSERAMWRAADRVLPVTHVLARRIAAAGVREDRIVVIANGVDLARFTPGDATAMRRGLGLEGRLVLGFTGFVREWHRADMIVDLLAQDVLPPHSHFLIVGDGPVREALVAQAQRLGVADRLTITGVVGRDVVMDYVRCFDIALQPDVVIYASPLKLMEYMALALAIIAPDRENIRECVTHEESAILVQPESAASLAQALQRLAGDERLRRRLGQAARNALLARGMTWQNNAMRIASLIRDVQKRCARA